MRNENGTIISETRLTRSNLCFLLQNNKVSLNSFPATKEKRKKYSYFGESSEECIIIDLVENSVATMDKKLGFFSIIF